MVWDVTWSPTVKGRVLSLRALGSPVGCRLVSFGVCLWRGRSACAIAPVLAVVQVQGVLLTSGSVLKGPGSIFLRALRAQ